jgi:hypothetical protein
MPAVSLTVLNRYSICGAAIAPLPPSSVSKPVIALPSLIALLHSIIRNIHIKTVAVAKLYDRTKTRINAAEYEEL